MTDYRELISQALLARESSYSPYSHFSVGAALLTAEGRIYRGCNIESCSYGPTNCAERTAVFKAVSEGERAFSAIAIVGSPDAEEAPLTHTAYPCGVCRQVLAEFCDMDLEVIVARSCDDFEVYTLGQLLPQAFTPRSL
ncbi:MAG: cytidine deaminase [Clostridiales bacterium]|nr:cytidine deaminase [Clostridiales bacterium]